MSRPRIAYGCPKTRFEYRPLQEPPRVRRDAALWQRRISFDLGRRPIAVHDCTARATDPWSAPAALRLGETYREPPAGMAADPALGERAGYRDRNYAHRRGTDGR